MGFATASSSLLKMVDQSASSTLGMEDSRMGTRAPGKERGFKEVLEILLTASNQDKIGSARAHPSVCIKAWRDSITSNALTASELAKVMGSLVEQHLSKALGDARARGPTWMWTDFERWAGSLVTDTDNRALKLMYTSAMQAAHESTPNFAVRVSRIAEACTETSIDITPLPRAISTMVYDQELKAKLTNCYETASNIGSKVVWLRDMTPPAPGIVNMYERLIRLDQDVLLERAGNKAPLAQRQQRWGCRVCKSLDHKAADCPHGEPQRPREDRQGPARQDQTKWAPFLPPLEKQWKTKYEPQDKKRQRDESDRDRDRDRDHDHDRDRDRGQDSNKKRN
jgi:hypothetical protein